MKEVYGDRTLLHFAVLFSSLSPKGSQMCLELVKYSNEIPSAHQFFVPCKLHAERVEIKQTCNVRKSVVRCAANRTIA